MKISKTLHISSLLKLTLTPVVLLLMLASTGCSDISKLNSPNVKKAYNGACYEKGKPGYDQVKAFVDYENISECLRAGGTLPQR